MSLIDREPAMLQLSPYLAGVPRVFRTAWKRARKFEAIDLLDQSKTTKAGLMRDYSVAELTRHWKDDPNVRAEEFGQQLLFVIERTFAFRVKKADLASCSSNYPTEQDQNFRNQGQIDGLPPSYNFELVYILNHTETDIHDIRVVCLNGDEPYWWQSIEKPADNIYDLFQNQRDPNSPDTKQKPKEGDADDDEITISPKKT
jgi:hypothetical protein